jgi:hypothetical protein
MTQEREFKPFDDGWSHRKKLCYDLVCDVTATLGYVQLIVAPDRELSQTESEKVLRAALKNAEITVQRVQELYAILCAEERGPVAQAPLDA